MLFHQRNHRDMDSKSSGKAYHDSMRGLPKTSSGMTLQLDGPRPPVGRSHMWSRFRLPSGSHGGVHPPLEERSPARLCDERKELIGSVLGSAAQSLDEALPG